VVAADIPSGVSADSGAVLGAVVKCVRTVTFSMGKPGHYLEPGCEYAGRVDICPIGIPAEMLDKAFCGVEVLDAGDLRLPKRPRVSHKGDYGRVLILGGSVGYTGAPNLTAAAAVRAGAGLVYLGVPESIWSVCAVKNAEAMPFPLPGDEEGRFAPAAVEALARRELRRDVLALGPGMGRGDGVKTLVQTLVGQSECPVVLDADALWAVSENLSVLKECKAPVVITPHMGEFRRLGGDKTGDRLADALSFAAEYGCVTVLKGHRTIVAFPEGDAYILTTGNPGMARGGSGDVLTGILAAMLGQRPVREAVLTACLLHGAAGDACAEEKGEYGMTPTDMIERLPYIMKGITE
jgi:NAD(P)H-hydrate epimerase